MKKEANWQKIENINSYTDRSIDEYVNNYTSNSINTQSFLTAERYREREREKGGDVNEKPTQKINVTIHEL